MQISKKILALSGAIAALMLADAAKAADLPVYKKAPVVAPAPYSWTGFYVGANAGGGWGSTCWTWTSIQLDLGCHDVSGPLAGGQFGYNWQTNNFVLGAEISGDWANLKGSNIPAVSLQGTDNTQLTALGLATLRAGVAWDRALVYGKGGAAWAHEKYTRICNGVTATGACLPVGVIAETSSENRAGWVVGVGIEYALLAKLSLALEYDYVGFGTSHPGLVPQGPYSCGAGRGVPCGLDVKQNLSVVTARLNWRFGE